MLVERELQIGGIDRPVTFNMFFDPADAQDSFMLSFFDAGKCPESELLWVMSHVLHEGDFAIDVGANVGYFSLFMSRLVGQTGMVFAFEPGKDNLASISRHITTNKITNVQVIDQPAWCRVEPVTFYLNSDSRGSHALFDPGYFPANCKSRETPRPVPMQATTLDALDTDKSRVKLIKIDTEGAEQKILEGASDMLATYHPPYIVPEMNPHGLYQSGCNTEGFRSFMRGFGYEMFVIHGTDKLPSLVPQESRLHYINDYMICNVLFSTLEMVGKGWPEVYGND